MLGVIAKALVLLFRWENFAFAALGITGGIILGAIPGLGASMAIVILLPITYYLPPVLSMMLLIGLYRGGIYGGSISSILINAPGTPAAAATVLDGYKMAKNGQAGKALDTAIYASVAGDAFGIILLILFAEPIARLALKFGPAEYFSLILLSLTIVAAISGKSITKGLIVAVFGILLATVGLDPMLGTLRFTFGQQYLVEGIPYIPLLIGLFAMSEVYIQIERGMKKDLHSSITADEKDITNSRLSFKEFFSIRKLLAQSAIIGSVFGALPGIGATASAFAAYGLAQKTSKHPEKYGTGFYEGVAAPEAANNAVCGSALIPMIALGIPGDATTAILLGGFMLAGLTPGPLVFQKSGPTVYAIFIGMLLTGVLLFAIAKIAIKLFVRIIDIPKHILFAVVAPMCIVGSYVYGNNLYSVWVMFLGSILGYFMQKFEFPQAPLIISMVLTPTLESSLRQALVLSNGSLSIFVTRPFSVLFLVLAAISIFTAFYAYKKERKKAEEV